MAPNTSISAREAILQSIREHLATSVPHDAIHGEKPAESVGVHENENGFSDLTQILPSEAGGQNRSSLVDTFKESLEAVGGHCIVVRTESEIEAALAHILSGLRELQLPSRRIAISNAPTLEQWTRNAGSDLEIAKSPSATESFHYDVGISTAQAGIAETGTLVLESEAERHRLVSLVPPVHIAIIRASQICLTLGETLAGLKRGNGLNPTITFITGPSRTADIELTLTVGVHGPQELYVIVIQDAEVK